MGMFIPPRVAAELIEERRRHSAEVWDCLVLPPDREWTALLKEVDENLYMVRSKHWVKTGLPLVPGGCWHIIRDNSDKGAPETIIPLFDEAEQKMLEPGSWVFDMLRRNDLQRPGALKERQRTEERLEAAQERRRRAEREDRRKEIEERFKAGNGAFISMDNTTPWTQTVRGRKPGKKP